MPAFITGVQSFLPHKPVPNDRIEHVLGMISDRPSDVKDLILGRNGIKWRYYAVDPQTHKLTHSNAELTATCVRQLCEASGVPLNEIPLLACGTSSPDQMIPNHASMVLGLLGSHPCEAISTAGVCCSGMTALKYASLSLQAGQCDKAVATGSELASGALRSQQFEPQMARSDVENPYINFDQEFLRFMLSDGAGAVLIANRPCDDRVSLRIDWLDVISYANECETCMYAGGMKNPDGTLRGWRQEELGLEEVIKQGYFNLSQDVNALMKYIVPQSVKALAWIRGRHPELRADQVDYFLPHLSSMLFKQPLYDSMVTSGFDIPLNRWFTNLPYKGNTGSASIFIMLDELVKSGKLKSGQHVLCAVPESARFTYAAMHLTVM
jgi:3-oxoacyl-[acyl-carrier-protein] synthase-3